MIIPTRTLGRTGLEVTQLGYGAMEVRGNRIWNGHPCTEAQVGPYPDRRFVDNGINFIDTANDYGTSELFIGSFLSHRRGDYYLATK